MEVFTAQAKPSMPDTHLAVTMLDFVRVFRGIDWKKQASQVLWARNGWPGVALVREEDGFRLWLCAYDWRVDFGIPQDQEGEPSNGFIVGVSTVADDFAEARCDSGLPIVDCDFFYTNSTEVEALVRMFLENRDADLIGQLQQSVSVSRFSHGGAGK